MPNEPIALDRAIRLKTALEASIFILLEEFRKETNLPISSIRLVYCQVYPLSGDRVTQMLESVKLEVSLP